MISSRDVFSVCLTFLFSVVEARLVQARWVKEGATKADDECIIASKDASATENRAMLFSGVNDVARNNNNAGEKQSTWWLRRKKPSK